MTDRLSGIKLIAGFAIVFALFQWLGAVLHSDRGQAGIAIGNLIVIATLFFQWLIFGGGIRHNLIRLGFSSPTMYGMSFTVIVCILLLAAFPLYSISTGSHIGIATEWLWTIPGLFFQAGIAEEALFRGFLFGNLRNDRSFWRAALISTVPFAIVHLFLFVTMPFPVAAAAFLLSVVLSFPLAYLYELGGRTIWAPALLHFVVQGAIKLVAIPDEAMGPLAVVWMAACGVIPLLVFLVPLRTAINETKR